jgi:hypothetical protein
MIRDLLDRTIENPWGPRMPWLQDSSFGAMTDALSFISQKPLNPFHIEGGVSF